MTTPVLIALMKPGDTFVFTFSDISGESQELRGDADAVYMMLTIFDDIRIIDSLCQGCLNATEIDVAYNIWHEKTGPTESLTPDVLLEILDKPL